MNDESIKYSIALNRITIVNRRADSLASQINALENTLKNNVCIDDKAIEYDTLNDIKSDIKYIRRSLKNSLIPYIKRKMDETTL